MKKVVKKEKPVKKITKKETKKEVNESFLKGVVKETKKVRWPNKKEMVTYTVATIVCILVFVVFFTGVDLILAGIKTLLGMVK